MPSDHCFLLGAAEQHLLWGELQWGQSKSKQPRSLMHRLRDKEHGGHQTWPLANARKIPYSLLTAEGIN